MHAHYRTELANLGADYQRDKARLNGAHKAERDALHAEVRQFTEKAIQGLTEEQRREQRTIAWRERSLLGRMWNAYDAGRPSGGTSGRVGQTLWATFSRSARLSGLRQSRAEQRNAVYNDLKAWTRDRMAEVRARHGQEFNATYQRFQAARSSTLGQYEVEQKEYRRLWVERNQANREAWQTLRAKCLPLARERQRHMRQKENIRRIEEEWTQDRDQRGKTRGPRVRDQGRDR